MWKGCFIDFERTNTIYPDCAWDDAAADDCPVKSICKVTKDKCEYWRLISPEQKEFVIY